MLPRRRRTDEPLLRVLLADDHQVLLEGLVRLLSGHFDVVGTETNATAVPERARTLTPDVIVLDLSMPGGGFNALRQLVSDGFPGKIVVLTMHAEREVGREALEAGAHGFVVKQSAGSELIDALRTVSEGQTYVSPAVSKLMEDPSPTPIPQPSARQLEVLRLLAEGLRTKEIAARLEVSPRTVESHKQDLMRTLHLDSTAKLIRYALTHGLIN